MYSSTRHSSGQSIISSFNLSIVAGFACLAVVVATMPTWMSYVLFSLVGGAPVSPGCDQVNRYADDVGSQWNIRNNFFAGDTITIDNPVSANGVFEVSHWVDSTSFILPHDMASLPHSVSNTLPESGEYSVSVLLPLNSNPGQIGSGRLHCRPGRFSAQDIDGKPIIPLFP
jgi:hypothetical protein